MAAESSFAPPSPSAERFRRPISRGRAESSFKRASLFRIHHSTPAPLQPPRRPNCRHRGNKEIKPPSHHVAKTLFAGRGRVRTDLLDPNQGKAHPGPPSIHQALGKNQCHLVNQSRRKSMNITRYNPARDFADLFERFSWPFARDEGLQAMTTSDWVPSVDISETDDEFLIKMEVPEVKKEDIKIQVNNGMLSISGERQEEKKDKKHHRMERFYGAFSRSFSLPENVSEKDIDAEQKNGIKTCI
jgi:HSP20 family protein